VLAPSHLASWPVRPYEYVKAKSSYNEPLKTLKDVEAFLRRCYPTLGSRRYSSVRTKWSGGWLLREVQRSCGDEHRTCKACADQPLGLLHVKIPNRAFHQYFTPTWRSHMGGSWTQEALFIVHAGDSAGTTATIESYALFPLPFLFMRSWESYTTCIDTETPAEGFVWSVDIQWLDSYHDAIICVISQLCIRTIILKSPCAIYIIYTSRYIVVCVWFHWFSWSYCLVPLHGSAWAPLREPGQNQ